MRERERNWYDRNKVEVRKEGDRLVSGRKRETKLLLPKRKQRTKEITWCVQITREGEGGGSRGGWRKVRGGEKAVARDAIEHNTMRQ